MMNLDDLCAVLDGLGIEWANEDFADDERPAPPYIVLSAGFGETIYADNVAWVRWMPCEVLLYTAQRSYELESKIADALDAAGCAFEKSVTHVDGERLIEAAFAVNVTEELGA